MQVATKDQSVIESAAPYSSKLTTQKLLKATIKKKKVKLLYESYMIKKIC